MWEYDGFTWERKFPPKKSIVLFGGFIHGQGRSNDTWELTLVNQPPVAVCKDIEISVDLNCQIFISASDVDGGSYDPDDDPITLEIDNIGPFSVGTHYVNLTVTDEKGESDTCQATVNVVDTTPPVFDVANLPDVTGECAATVTTVPTATDNCAGIVYGNTTDPLQYTQQGTYTVTWTYDDGNGNISSQVQKVIVQDITPPEIDSLTASPEILWPPNHNMIPVVLTVTVSDNCDDSPLSEIIGVSSNEPENGLGDGDTAPDWEITGDLTLNLRAERSGTGTGRVYTITVMCTDASGNSSTETVTVTVPHNKAKKK